MRSSRRTSALAVVFVLCGAVLFQISDAGHFLGQVLLSQQRATRNVSRDDSGSTFRTSVGEWERKSGHGHRGSYMINENPEDYHWAYLEFPTMPAGSYDVYVTWPREAVNHLQGTPRMDEQIYRKTGNGGWEYVSEERVDLKNPREDARVRGRSWMKIGTVSLESKGNIAVRVWDGDVLIADAAWLVPVGTVIEAICGNELCEEDEDAVSCPADCGPVCGDGEREGAEGCDDGTANGQACTPACGQSCTYCSGICSVETVNGPACEEPSLEIVEPSADISIVSTEEYALRFTAPENPNARYANTLDQFHFEVSMDGGPWNEITAGSMTAYLNNDGQYEIHYTYFETFAECLANNDRCSTNNSFPTIKVAFCNDGPLRCNGDFIPRVYLPVQENNATLRFRITDAENSSLTDVSPGISFREAGADNTAPIISLIGDTHVTINAGSVYTDLGATAMDDTDGDISNRMVVSGIPGNTNTAGTYTITYNVSDATGNAAAEVNRILTIQDCGNGTREGTEQCDNGTGNGQQCTPQCGQSCSYCSTSCTTETVNGPACEEPSLEIVEPSADISIVPTEEYALRFSAPENPNPLFPYLDQFHFEVSMDGGPWNEITAGQMTAYQNSNEQYEIHYTYFESFDQCLANNERCSTSNTFPTFKVAFCTKDQSYRPLQCNGDSIPSVYLPVSQGNEELQFRITDADDGSLTDVSPAISFREAEEACGNGTREGTEQCDNGGSNGQACTAEYGQTCQYCSLTCTNVTVTGPRCGDSTTDAGNGEQCDDGSQNGQACTAGYGQTCQYCSPTCTNVTVTGPRCGDGTVDTGNGEECDDGGTASGDGCSAQCTNEHAAACEVTSLPALTYTAWIASGDLDGDGDLDLATLGEVLMGQGGTAISVFLNNGNGTFEARKDYTPGGVYRDIALGDFDKDGDKDIVLGINSFEQHIAVIANNGQGKFNGSPHTFSAGGGQFYHEVSVGDVNGDGDLDVFAGGLYDGGTIFFGGQGLTFSAEQGLGTVGGNEYHPTLVDVDNDGDLDAIATPHGAGGTNMQVFRNNGQGVFGPPTDYSHTPMNPYTNDLLTGDVNGDGFVDLVQLPNGGGFYVWMNDTHGAFTKTVYTEGIGRDGVLADFTGDGVRDLIGCVYVSANYNFRRGTGNGTFADTVAIPMQKTGRGMVAADFDGDGRKDLAQAMAESEDAVRIILDVGQCVGGDGAGGPVCGNGGREGTEECDNGNQNGQVCIALYGQTCEYCSSQCTSVTVTGPRCGDSTIDTGNGEQCDDGSQNGQACTAEYGQSCQYCSSQCASVTVTGPRCGDGTVDTGNGETCDDGGTAPGDGCSAQCTTERASAALNFTFADSTLNNTPLAGVHDYRNNQLNSDAGGHLSLEADSNNNAWLLEKGCYGYYGAQVREGYAGKSKALILRPFDQPEQTFEVAGMSTVDVTALAGLQVMYPFAQFELKADQPMKFSLRYYHRNTAGGSSITQNTASTSYLFHPGIPRGYEAYDVLVQDTGGHTIECPSYTPVMQHETGTCRQAFLNVRNGSCFWNECGNGVCEQGEADFFDPGGCGPSAPPGCLGAPGQLIRGTCTNDCQSQQDLCGNGITEGEERCDLGIQNGQICIAACNTSCQWCSSQCDTLYTEQGRACTVWGRSYSPTTGGGSANRPAAPVYACGNGRIESGEQCDSGTANGQACTPAYGQECRYCGGNCLWAIKEGPRCGDRNVDRNDLEECDDGNRTNGDGCSAQCRNEVQTTSSCDAGCQEQNVLDYFSYDGIFTVRSVVINAHYVFTDVRNSTTHPFTDITEDGATNQNDITVITQAMLRLSKPENNGIDIWKTYLSLDRNRDYLISTEEINAAALAYEAWLRGERQSRPSQEMLDIYEEMLYLVRYLSQH